jgi:hypothetical protein
MRIKRLCDRAAELFNRRDRFDILSRQNPADVQYSGVETVLIKLIDQLVRRLDCLDIIVGVNTLRPDVKTESVKLMSGFPDCFSKREHIFCRTAELIL